MVSSGLGTKFPETRRPGCLCNEMKAPGHERKLHLDGTEKPVFRKFWIATVISGTCVAAHDSAATWMINVSTGSPFFISLMSTVASLPFFLFTLPAGALADKVDRQKLVCFINFGLAAAATSLAVLGWLHLFNPYIILASVFCIGI